MKKSEIKNVQLFIEYVNFIKCTTYCIVSYKSGILREYKKPPKTVCKWLENKMHCYEQSIYDAKNMKHTFIYTYRG